MTRVGLLSDNHGWLEPGSLDYFAECDEIWHAGDLGSLAVAEALAACKPLRAVWGNIDGPELRDRYPEELMFEVESLQVWMLHIAGRPGRYAAGLTRRLRSRPVDVLVCGHSHILRIERDSKFGHWYLNPGACGQEGFHEVKTMLRFTLHRGRMSDMQIIELGPRGSVKRQVEKGTTEHA